MALPNRVEQIQQPEKFFPVEVWKAVYPASASICPGSVVAEGTPVVIKMVRDESASAARHWGPRMQDLGKRACDVRDEDVAATVEVGSEGGITFVATEYLDPALGWMTLEDAAPKTSLPVDRSVRIAWHVAKALVAVEAAGAVHGCITPSKVMVAPYHYDRTFDYVKLRDIGLGHLRVYEDYSAISLQLALYLAPELIEIGREPDIRSDIYSYGAVFFRILTGWPPVQDKTVNDIFERKIATKGPPRIITQRPNLPITHADAIDDVMGKMLALDPAARFQTARELLDRIEALAASLRIELLPPPPPPEPIQTVDIWRDRELVVARMGAVFPDRCVLCNDAAHGLKIRRHFYWHSFFLYWLALFPGLLVYALFAAIFERHAALDVGLCREHRQRQWVSLGFICVLLTAGVATIGWAWYTQSWLVAGFGAALFFAAAMIDFGFRTILSAKHIDSELVWIRGAGKRFVESLPDAETPTQG